MVHQDCRLSERRFDFHDMRVSGEKTALVQIATLRALDPRARISSEHHEAFGEVSMLPWTTREISLLIGLWPTASATQISKRLNRSRGSVCGKAMRLRWRAAGRCGKAFQGASGGADAAGSHQGNGNIDQDRKADAADRWHRAAARNAVLFAD